MDYETSSMLVISWNKEQRKSTLIFYPWTNPRRTKKRPGRLLKKLLLNWASKERSTSLGSNKPQQDGDCVQPKSSAMCVSRTLDLAVAGSPKASTLPLFPSVRRATRAWQHLRMHRIIQARLQKASGERKFREMDTKTKAPLFLFSLSPSLWQKLTFRKSSRRCYRKQQRYVQTGSTNSCVASPLCHPIQEVHLLLIPQSNADTAACFTAALILSFLLPFHQCSHSGAIKVLLLFERHCLIWCRFSIIVISQIFISGWLGPNAAIDL